MSDPTQPILLIEWVGLGQTSILPLRLNCKGLLAIMPVKTVTREI